MLTGAPTSVKGRDIYLGESQFWDCSKGCGGKAGLDSTNNVVKPIDNGACDNVRDTGLLVVTCLQHGNSQSGKWRRI